MKKATLIAAALFGLLPVYAHADELQSFQFKDSDPIIPGTYGAYFGNPPQNQSRTNPGLIASDFLSGQDVWVSLGSYSPGYCSKAITGVNQSGATETFSAKAVIKDASGAVVSSATLGKGNAPYLLWNAQTRTGELSSNYSIEVSPTVTCKTVDAECYSGQLAAAGIAAGPSGTKHCIYTENINTYNGDTRSYQFSVYDANNLFTVTPSSATKSTNANQDITFNFFDSTLGAIGAKIYEYIDYSTTNSNAGSIYNSSKVSPILIKRAFATTTSTTDVTRHFDYKLYTYRWYTSDWSTCQNATQTRTVTCREEPTGVAVDGATYCGSPQPSSIPTTRSCTIEPPQSELVCWPDQGGLTASNLWKIDTTNHLRYYVGSNNWDGDGHSCIMVWNYGNGTWVSGAKYKYADRREDSGKPSITPAQYTGGYPTCNKGTQPGSTISSGGADGCTGGDDLFIGRCSQEDSAKAQNQPSPYGGFYRWEDGWCVVGGASPAGATTVSKNNATDAQLVAESYGNHSAKETTYATEIQNRLVALFDSLSVKAIAAGTEKTGTPWFTRGVDLITSGTPAPTVVLSVNNSDVSIATKSATVCKNDPVTLSWKATADSDSSCIAGGSWSGSKTCQNGQLQQQTFSITSTGTFTYSLTATNSIGSKTDSVSIVVNTCTPPTVSLNVTQNPCNVPSATAGDTCKSNMVGGAEKNLPLLSGTTTAAGIKIYKLANGSYTDVTSSYAPVKNSPITSSINGVTVGTSANPSFALRAFTYSWKVKDLQSCVNNKRLYVYGCYRDKDNILADDSVCSLQKHPDDYVACVTPDCSSQQQSWTVGGNTCTASVPSTSNGTSKTVSASDVGTTGSATFKCDGNTDTWALQSGASCSVVAVCGSANNGTVSSNPAGGAACASGTQNSSDAVASDGKYNWTCAIGSSTATCSANRTAFCGSASGATVTSSPTGTAACPFGTQTTTDGTASDGTYNWTCANGSSTATCSANKQQLGCSVPPSMTWTASGVTCTGNRTSSATTINNGDSAAYVDSFACPSGRPPTDGSNTYTCTNGTLVSSGGDCEVTPQADCGGGGSL